MNKLKNILLVVLSSVLLALLFFRQRPTGNDLLPVVVKTDTLTIVKTDTIKVVQPIRLSQTVVKIDTIYIRDTIAIPVPIKQSYYEGADYEAWISGYKPKLDSRNVFRPVEVKYITKTEIIRERARKWGVGAQAGYGWNGEKLTPYIGIGVTYQIINF